MKKKNQVIWIATPLMDQIADAALTAFEDMRAMFKEESK